MGLALCVKYAALYSIYLCFALMAQDFWRNRLRDRSLSALRLCSEAGAQCLAVVAIPIAVYLSVFHIHLSLLTRAGVHDSLMTSAFQVREGKQKRGIIINLPVFGSSVYGKSNTVKRVL